MTTQPREYAGPGLPGVSPCNACEEPLRACWQFRSDDRFCPLCARQVLHLRLGQGWRGKDPETGQERISWQPAEPATGDSRVWLYWQSGGELILCLTHSRGVNGKYHRNYLPEVDLRASGADFRSGETSLSFACAELIAHERASLFHALRFEPAGTPVGPETDGVNGAVRLALGDELVERNAVLLPLPKRPVECRCVDGVPPGPNKPIVLYQRNQRVPLRMELAAKTHVWVTGCSVSDSGGTPATVKELGEVRPSASGAGSGQFASPVALAPGTKKSFSLILDTTRWQPGKPVKLTGHFQLRGLMRSRYEQTFELIQGARVHFEPALVQTSVQLGQEHRIGFQFSAVDTAEPIKIESCVVRITPDVGDWLKVQQPARGALPMTVTPGREEDLILLVDTRRLDRVRFRAASLHGEVRLVDSAGRHWVCFVEVEVQRAQSLGLPVAFDWGTSNTCAAYSEGVTAASPPRPIPLGDPVSRRGDKPAAPAGAAEPLPPGAREGSPDPFRDLETFPSNVYFKDISDTNNPVLLVGPEADSLAQLHPECHLRSVKRKFQFRKQVFVMDETGNRHIYPVEELVRHLLRSLIARAEFNLRKEVHVIGLTFPTKWPRSVLTRFRKVARELEAQLRRERSPAGGGEASRVTVEKPEIDEANAVAIQLLTSDLVRDKADLRGKFHLIAYDFGGGTVDTSVLEVTRNGEDVSTRYIGIGGRRDFGGDEVTRAVMMLLHKRLSDFLRGLSLKVPQPGGGEAEVKLLEVPLVADGNSMDEGPGAVARFRMGRKNWDSLWRIAENAKIRLSRGGDMGAALAADLTQIGDDLACVFAPTGRQAQQGPTVMLTLEKVLLDDSVQQIPDLQMTLEQACAEPIEDIDGANDGAEFNVADRIEDTIEELQYQCWKAGIEPQVIVLAGGGCRLPLIKERMRQAFQLKTEEYLISDPDFSKRRVCYGLANYLYLRTADKFGPGLARSVDVIHHPLGVQRRKGGDVIELEFCTVVPVGARVDAPDVWHRFEFRPARLPRAGRLSIYVEIWRNGAKQGVRQQPVGGPEAWKTGGKAIEFGFFDLSRPPDVEVPGCRAEPLPDIGGETCAAEIRLVDPRTVELRVCAGDARYGAYRLIPATTEGDLEMLLQG